MATTVKIELTLLSCIVDNYDCFLTLTQELEKRGFQSNDISVLMSDKAHSRYFAIRENNKAPEGTTIGGISGGLLGLLVGGFALIGNILAPGTGLIISGPLIGALTGGAIGATAGGLIGALAGAGIPEHEAKFFEEALQDENNILVVTRVPKEQVKEIKALYHRLECRHIKEN